MSEAESNHRAWLRKAEHDLLNIENNLAAARTPWDTVCFHAQQATEKVLKAFLVYHGQDPPHTHDLVVLLTQCVDVEAALADLETDCRNLTFYAVTVRYPDDHYEPDRPPRLRALRAGRGGDCAGGRKILMTPLPCIFGAMTNSIRVYADTSVYGGVEDDEFAEDSRAFFEQVRRGRFALTVSAVVAEEIVGAPEAVREHFDAMLVHAEVLDVTPEALSLQNAYLDAGILTPKWQEDALHVALASANECEIIVSWNFRHIVHFQKIPKYNAVNALHGYSSVAIHSPPEVLADADEND